MKSALKFVFVVAVFALTCWLGQAAPVQAAYPACWNLRDCSPEGARTLCWNINAELAVCRCVNGWWSCSTAG